MTSPPKRTDDVPALIREYLARCHMMQLTTVRDGQPWCCSLYYVADADHNLYWASWPTRRHSLEVEAHAKVAAAIPVHFAKSEKVVGLQFEGVAQEIIEPANIRPAAQLYAEKFGRSAKWVEEFSARRTVHRLYKLTPSLVVLFDERTFPDDPRKEWRLPVLG